MKFTLSTIALVATLLAQDALAGVAGVHPKHGQRHAAARREPSEAINAPEIVAREIVYVTNTIHRTVTVIGGNGNAKAAAATPVPASQPDVKAFIKGLGPDAAAAWENWYATKDQQQTTLQKVPAPAAPTQAPAPPVVEAPAPEAPKKAAPAPPVVEAPAPAAPKPETNAAVFVEQPKGTAPHGGKRGLAYNDANLVQQLLAGTTGRASWAYNWGSTPGDLPAGVEYVPMVWGVQPQHTNNWVEMANKALASGSTHLLGFNEPDHWEQAKVDPATCASAYKQHMQPFAGKAKLGAPAVTNGEAAKNMGLTYLKQFMDACADCTIDFVPIHWYDSASNFEYFKKHIQDAKAVAGGRPLWLTEFGAAGSDAEQGAFLEQALPWLESQDYVERYAYFWVDKVLISSPTIKAAYLNAA